MVNLCVLPSVTSLTFGERKNDNNMLKGGINTNFTVQNIKSCTYLKGIKDSDYIPTIIKSDKYIFGYQTIGKDNNNMYYGCNTDVGFNQDLNSKNIVWKKSIYSFPRYNTEYVYSKKDAKDVCNIYGLRQCSKNEIKNRQQCACGWVSDNDSPIFWLNTTEKCNVKGCTPGFNTCTEKGMKGNAYCCGDVLDNKYSMCPSNYPYPVSTTKALPIYGGTVGGNNTFCCNKQSNTNGFCNDKGIADAILSNDAIACANPPCKQYISSNENDSVSNNTVSSKLLSTKSTEDSEEGKIEMSNTNQTMWKPIENFSNYESKYIYINSIILIFVVFLIRLLW